MDGFVKNAFISNAMGAACGVMGWAAQDFWQATPFDFMNAWHGFEMFHGLKKADDLSHHDVLRLRQLLEENKNGIR